MGGGDDFRQMLAQRRVKRSRQIEEKRAVAGERIQALEEKERQRMEQFKSSLGLQDRFQKKAD